MVDVFEIRGKVDLDLEPFTSKIVTANEQLAELGKGVNLNFLEKNDFLGKIDLLKDKLGQVGLEAEKITTAFTKIEGLEKLLGQLDLVKEKVGTVKSEVDSVSTSTNNVAKATVRWGEALASVSPNFQSMMYSMEAIQGQTMSAVAELGSLRVEEGTQIKKNLTYYEQELQVAKQFENAEQGLIRGYVEQGRAIEQANALEKQRLATLREEMNVAKRLGDTYLKNTREQNRQLTYEREMLMVEEQFSTVIGDEIASKFQYNSLLEESLVLEKEILSLMGNQTTMTGEEIAEETKKLNTLRQELDLNREILNLEKQQTMEEAKQTKEKMSGMGASAKGNKLDKMGYLPSRIGSMAITMLGYQEIMDVWQKTTSNINAKTQFNSYADLLKTDNRYLKQTKQSTADVTKGINELNKALTDTYKGGKNLQQMYSKVDMRQVGANALDTAFKYGVQAENLDELTEVMAIYSSEFVRQGRSQEDSILAVNDALDGEFRRLKEVNIGKEELQEHGYEEGNTLSLIRAMREIAEERGYDVTAQKITTLSEAITQAELELAFLLSDLFELAEPSLIYALGKVVELFRFLGQGVKQLKDYLKGLPQPVKDFLKAFGGNAMLGLVGLWIGRKIYGAVSNMSLFGGAWSKLMEKLGRTKGMDKATESMGKMGQTTGGTVSNTSAKDGLKNWGKNLAKNLGKMAEVFIEVAVAIAMAWALLKEAMWMIADIGKQWESQKAEFNQGMDFIKSYGIWILAISGVMAIALDYFTKADIGRDDYVNMAKTGLKVAEGLAISMGLIAEAIGLLILPLGAIIILGATYNWQQSNVESGLKVIKGVGTVLNTIASDDSIMVFLLGFMAVSTIMAFGGAELIALPLAIGMAVTMGLIAEAIGLLILPLGAIALLGASASALNEGNINQGAETIRMIGRVLKVLSDAMVDLFIVDIATLGIMLTEKASQLLTGKTGLQALTDDIIPSLTDFIKDFNGLDMGEPVDQAKVQAIQQMATDIPPLFQAIQKVNNAMGTSDAVGNIFGALGGGISGAIGMGLSSKLNQLYNDIKDVMDFANKLGGLGTGGNANTTAIQQTANAITQLKTKLNLFITTISGASARVQSASTRLGNALPTGFKTGSASFNSTVVSTLAKGISAVQSRYGTWLSGGRASAQKLNDGFKTFGGKLRSTITTEMGYALRTLDSYKDDFYRKGQALGKQLSDGFESSGGLNVGSPANIARTIAKEMEYSMLALDTGKQLMYRGGQALGQALTNGYNSYGNLRTDVGVLASKGVSNEQLQANATSVQANGKINQQTPKIFAPTVNIDMSNSTIIGVQDLDARIRQSVDKAMIEYNSPNGAIGY